MTEMVPVWSGPPALLSQLLGELAHALAYHCSVCHYPQEALDPALLSQLLGKLAHVLTQHCSSL